MARPLVIGARNTALARVQAFEVGRALAQRHPGIALEYVFRASAGDLSSEPDAAAITLRGGFTGDLGEALDRGAIDIAVHSWKDLPSGPRLRTTVAATRPRADCRDVLLLRRDAWKSSAQPLRILSSSARRRRNLDEFLSWALPAAAPATLFLPVRGDIETRLAKLARGDGDALVIAKAALDRLLGDTEPDFAGARVHVRAVLAACRIIVLPLSVSPAAPGQGALAVEIARGRRDLATLLAEVNDPDTFRRVTRERALAGELGDDSAPLGISIVGYEFGEVEFIRGEIRGEAIAATTLRPAAGPLPRAERGGDVWLGDQPGADPFERVPLGPAAPPVDGHTGVLVARDEALPEHWDISRAAAVWTPGLATWRKLARRGVWVNGCDDGLGENGVAELRALFPAAARWLKLTHASGFDSPQLRSVATYRLAPRRPPLATAAHTHFFWRSGSQFRAYLRANPRLAGAWHGCGPGNTLRVIGQEIGTKRVRPFLSAGRFRLEVAG